MTISRPLRRSLPAVYIDLIRDGVPQAELWERGDVAVYNAVLRVAMSAQHRGWTMLEWLEEILDGRLGRQAAVRHGKRRSDLDTRRALGDIWERAEDIIARQPRLTRAQSSALALTRAAAMREALNRGDYNLTEDEHLVMECVLQHVEKGYLNPPIPRHRFEERTAIGNTTLRKVLDGLVRRELLRADRQGRPSGPHALQRRAHRWSLPAEPPRPDDEPTAGLLAAS